MPSIVIRPVSLGLKRNRCLDVSASMNVTLFLERSLVGLAYHNLHPVADARDRPRMGWRESVHSIR
jgi:hypothetical protein